MIAMYRQGDVLIVEEETAERLGLAAREQYGSGRKIEPGPDGIIVAEGEATGHNHVVVGPNVLATQQRGAIHLVLTAAAVLRHLKEGQKAEHDPIDLPPGRYYALIQRQYIGKRQVERVVD